jgi:hypothetical protein
VVVGKKRVDFIVEGVMVEIKAHAELQDVHFVQTLLSKSQQLLSGIAAQLWGTALTNQAPGKLSFRVTTRLISTPGAANQSVIHLSSAPQ